MFYLVYALKSILQRRRQYISLFAVCTISVCIIISLLSVCDGMLKALNTKSIQYYGGELQIWSGNRFALDNAEEISHKIEEHLHSMKIKNIINKRFDFDGTFTEFYFEGATTYCRVLKGINLDSEKELLSKMTFVNGDLNNIDSDYILISEPIAQKLGCKTGDSITVMVKTLNEYINTVKLEVAGVFQDSSLFGMYTSYLDINALRSMAEYPVDYINRLGIYTPETTFSTNKIKKLQNLIEKDFNFAPLPKNKEQYIVESWQDVNASYALITLDANRPEVVMMSNALRLIVYLIIIPLVLIVAIGIGCSYRVVILKRIVETSTFRALGLKPDGVEKLFFTEVLMLLAVGFVLGTSLSFGVTGILSQFNFSFIPAFDLFLIGGRIQPDFSLLKTIVVLVIIALSTLACVFVTLRNIIHLSPAKAFATTV